MSVNCVAKKESEHQTQVALIQWWDAQAQAWGHCDRCLFAVPNGGMRNKITAAMLKQEGVRAGVPDLMLAIPTDRYCGLFIEMKRADRTSRPTKEQRTYRKLLQLYGYQSVVCYGFDEAVAEIKRYLGK